MPPPADDVRKLVFLCVPGDGAAVRPRKGMVPLIVGETWAQFEERVCKRLGLGGGLGGIYAWDGGPRIGSIAELMDVDEGRTLVVLARADGGDAPGSGSGLGSEPVRDARGYGSGSRGRDGAEVNSDGSGHSHLDAAHTHGRAGSCGGEVCATGRANCSSGGQQQRQGSTVLKSVRVHTAAELAAAAAGAADAAAGGVGAGAGYGALLPVDEVGEDKYLARKRRAAERRRGGSLRGGHLSVRRVLLLAALVCALATFSLWMLSYRGGHVLERIRERSERPGGGWVRSVSAQVATAH